MTATPSEIDPTKCSVVQCVAACPEQGSHQVLGMIRKKAHLVGPTNCIGHGACKTVCPANAITLVLVGASRLDIPRVTRIFRQRAGRFSLANSAVG